jgi:glycine cleavage system H lipoate-binding protein
MSQENIGIKAFVAGEALEAYRRVKLMAGSGTQVDYADAGVAFIGITAAAAALGEMVSVVLKTTGRTFKLCAAGAIAVGGDFYGALDGKISATVSGSIQGKVLEAPASDGEIVETILS